MTPTAIVIARDDDPHLARVGDELVACGIDTTSLPLGLPATDYEFEWTGREFRMTTPTAAFADEDFAAAEYVIYLPLSVNDPPHVQVDAPPGERSFASREWEECFASAMHHWHDLNPAAWTTDLRAAELQGRKLYLLSRASELGFAVPDSVVTTTLQSADVDRLSPVVAKAIGKWQQISPDSYFTTTLLDPSIASILTSSRATVPSFLQRRVEADEELRVYAVRNSTIALSIHRADGFDGIDIRTADAGEVEVMLVRDVPAPVRDLHRLRHALGRPYCVFDLLRTGHDYLLIDINPTGSWLSYASFYDVDITPLFVRAIIDS